jgi:acetylornithine/LysW-gamma-L-lysine aminotransferase
MDELIEFERNYGSGIYSVKDFRIDHGSGVYLYTADGRKLLDFNSGHGVANLGHCHPNVVKAIKDQSEKLLTLHSAFPIEARARFFKTMSTILPSGLNKIFITNSGTESVEGALKVALVNKKNITNPNIIAMKRSFHGRTLGSLSLTFNPDYRKSFTPMLYPNVKFASYNNVDSVKELIDENTIAVILEFVQGEGGVYPATEDFAHGLRELCTTKDVLLIDDEVQAGMGRCGRFFACQQFNVVPDIMCCAKGIAGGVPMGAVVSREDLFAKFGKGEHASTFGGNPLAAAASVATLNTLISEKIPENAEKMGIILRKHLQNLVDKYPEVVREVRGLGLLNGLQFKNKVAQYLGYCEEHDLLLLNAGMTVLRLLPPLIIKEEHINFAVNCIEEAIKNVKSS